ncbi:MAG TPA: amidase [Burkholderiales bacterium]|nr:amidase [Burkholderiales bacterium]
MTAGNEYTATEASRLMAAGKLTAVQLAEDCLARVAERERDVQAWAYMDARQVREQARKLDGETRRSPLHGIPVGVKDIIDTFDMPTEYGSPIYPGHRPRWDAACVAALRNSGALIMGKTVTTEFAVRHPNKTRNPHNLAHTPGGSSSGSAAGVADRMMPLALGTQTGGSVVRPAAYCGVVGLKPSYGIISRAGVKPNSESLDTVGLMARSVQDVAMMLAVMTAQPAEELKPARPRVGFYRTPQWPRADDATKALVEQAAGSLAKAGAVVREITLPAAFDSIEAAHGAINDYDMNRALAYERAHHADKISATLMAKIVQSDACTFDQYVAAQRHAAKCRALLAEAFADVDVLLVPSAPGEAPATLTTTGESTFNRIWTVLHVPAVTLPVFKGPTGLPIGVQLIGPFGGDLKMLACAEWVWRALL